MPSTQGSLPMTSAYFRLILREFDGGVRARRALLAGTAAADGAPAAEADEITLAQQLRQVRNANRLLPRDWALTVGAHLHAATHGPVGFAVVSAPTIRDAITVMTDYGWVRSPHFRLHASVDGDEVRLVPEDRVDLDPAERRALRDLVLSSTQGLLEGALGGPMAEGRVELPEPASGGLGSCTRWFHAPVRFGRREAAVVIPKRWLEVPCPLADPITFEASLRRLVAAERRLAGDGAWVPRVEQRIAVGRGRVAQDDVARRLGVSRRTLVRRLGESGASFRGLLEDGQKRHAAALLRQPGLSVAEVAWALGYQDAANFGRACRRWFGMSPGRYRRHLTM